eukprot:1396002-Rhodomonas_salina.1
MRRRHAAAPPRKGATLTLPTMASLGKLALPSTSADAYHKAVLSSSRFVSPIPPFLDQRSPPQSIVTAVQPGIDSVNVLVQLISPILGFQSKEGGQGK